MLNLDCRARNLTVSWNKSSGAQFYTATVTDSSGRFTNCQSFSDRCTISGLACGNIYRASVTASDANCIGQSSNIQSTDSGNKHTHKTDEVLACPRKKNAIVDAVDAVSKE